MTNENIKQFPKQSLWAMIGLTVITLTVYFSFWLRKHTKIINQLLPDNALPAFWFPLTFVFTILNFGMIIPEILSDDDPKVIAISNLIAKIDIILIIVWTFKVRNRMNIILDAKPKQPEWYNAFWTFFFGIFYLQYKVNKLQTNKIENT